MTIETVDDFVTAIWLRWVDVQNKITEPLLPFEDVEAIVRANWTNQGGKFRMKASAPTLTRDPLGSIAGRLLRWHRGGGQLDSYMIAQWDANHIVRKYEAPADWWDRLENTTVTLTVVLWGGSRATNAWARVLGL